MLGTQKRGPPAGRPRFPLGLLAVHEAPQVDGRAVVRQWPWPCCSKDSPVSGEGPSVCRSGLCGAVGLAAGCQDMGMMSEAVNKRGVSVSSSKTFTDFEKAKCAVMT